MCLCAQLNCQQFCLDHQNPKKFYAPHPRVPLAVYITYRALIAGYTCGFAIYYVSLPYHKRTPWIFLTVWSYLFQAITLLYELLVTVLKTYKKNQDHSSSSLDWYLKLKWVCHNITSSVPLIVTIVYWSLLWEKDTQKSDPTYLILDVQIHGINSIVALLDQVFDPNPMRPHHFIHPVTFLIIYGVFSAIHYGAGGEPVYPFLDWQKPGPTLLVCLIVYIGASGLHLMACLIKFGVSKLCPDLGYEILPDDAIPQSDDIQAANYGSNPSV